MTRPATLPAATPVALPATRYSIVAIVLHWAIAALLFGEVALGLRMEELHGPLRFAVFQVHKSIGITILLLVALRLVWRLVRTPPPVAAHGWERGLARAVHALFYLLLFALPLSGWAIVSTSRIVVPTLLYGTVPLPHLPGLGDLPAGVRDSWNAAARFIHVNFLLILYGLVALHVAGALKHHWFDREGDIARMVPGVRPGRVVDPPLIFIGLGVLFVISLGLWAPIRPRAAAPAPAAAPVAVPHAAVPAPARLPTPTPAGAGPAVPSAPVNPSPAASPVAGPATVALWAIQPASTLHWKTSWSGETIDGGFNRFDGTIAFDPAALDRSHVTIRVDLGTVFSGDAQRDETLKSADWFATAASTTATWTATRFRRTSPDHFVADGILRLKGVTLPVPVTFTLTIADDTATMRGRATIDRTAFRIGEGEFTATTDIPAAVALDLALTATRQ